MDVVYFFSGVCMTIEKRYAVKNEDTMAVVYLIEVEDGDIRLCDIMEYLIKSEEDLAKVPEFEEQVKKREQELVEKAVRLKKVAEKLESMGYTVVEEVLDETTGEWVYKF